MKKVVGIIPARWGSSRFPGKPLALLDDTPLILHTLKAAQQVLEHVVVATDDERIAEIVRGASGEAIMTDPDIPSGTLRCIEAYKRMGERADVIVNIQGDEPLLTPQQILKVANPEKEVATLAYRVNVDERDMVRDHNRVKVVLDEDDHALYFSRLPIPYSAHGFDPYTPYYIHIGLYGFTHEQFMRIGDMTPSALERTEHLEQLTWLFRGIKIKCHLTDFKPMGVDTPADLQLINNILKNNRK